MNEAVKGYKLALGLRATSADVSQWAYIKGMIGIIHFMSWLFGRNYKILHKSCHELIQAVRALNPAIDVNGVIIPVFIVGVLAYYNLFEDLTPSQCRIRVGHLRSVERTKTTSVI